MMKGKRRKNTKEKNSHTLPFQLGVVDEGKKDGEEIGQMLI